MRHGRAQILRTAQHAHAVSVIERLFVAHRLGLQVMAGASRVHAVAHQLAEIDLSFLPPGLLVARPSGAQHLLDGFGQPVGIAQHEL